MGIVRQPPVSLSPVDETPLSWQWINGQTPQDFTGWTAEFLIENCGAVVFRDAVTLAAGSVSVTVPAETAERIKSARQIDGLFQIRFISPTPSQNTVWQGPVVVLDIIT